MNIDYLIDKVKDKTVIFSLVSLLLSIIFYYLSINSNDYKDILIGIASGLFTSFLVAILTNYINGNVQIDLISKKVSENIIENIRKFEVIEFPSTNKWHSPFNKSLTDNLEKSSKYFFKGLTGHHFSLRILGILNSKNRNLSLNQAKLIILFPNYLSKADFRLVHEYKVGEKSPEAILKGQILQSIIGLYLIKQYFKSLEIGFSKLAFPTRYELLDNGIYLSGYNFTDNNKKYPKSYMYNNNSILYKIMQEDFQVSWEHLDFKIDLKQIDSKKSLLNIINKVFFNKNYKITLKDIDIICEKIRRDSYKYNF